MATPARVRSLEALEQFRAALVGFRADGIDAVTALQLEARRACDWLTDQKRFWQKAVRDCQDELTQAKSELSRKQMVGPNDRVPDTTVERKAVRRATERLEHAETKLEKCRRWEAELRREIDDFDGPVRTLANRFESELPKTIAAMGRIIGRVEAYLETNPSPPRSDPS